MFRIRRIFDRTTPANREIVNRIQSTLRDIFIDEREESILKVSRTLEDPLRYRYRSIIFVAEGADSRLLGAAVLLHFPDLSFCYLDYIFSSPDKAGRGIGSALYERLRTEAHSLKCRGIFLECPQEKPESVKDPAIIRENIARLKFYERYGARPIVNTRYETPLMDDDANPPYLLYDDLGQRRRLRKRETREIVRAILERKYNSLCPVEYVEMVVGSFHDDPVRIREPHFVKPELIKPIDKGTPRDMQIPLIVNEKHEIHHIGERGYVEAPVRIRSIMKGLDQSDLFERCKPAKYPESHITAIHDPGYVSYFKMICRKLPEGKSIYPYVFPIRNHSRPPKELLVRAGYYCIDTFTPLNKNAYLAAKRAVDCALTGADLLLKGTMLSYALVRPPGHHAGPEYFGGFCYFNSGAVAANKLSGNGKVAILDIDYHHGNGQQDIFYSRKDVMTLSIHGHPSFAYPYFSGFKEEVGEGDGIGFNHNIPLKERIDSLKYRDALESAVRAVKKYDPDFLVLPLGLDTARGDPTGTWDLSARDFELNGKMIGSLRLPTLVVQEGGYKNRILGTNARSFFRGFFEGTYTSEPVKLIGMSRV